MKKRGSRSMEISVDDLIALGKGLLIAAGGAAITYLSQWVTDADFGVWTPTVVAGASVLLNALRKFLADYSS